MPGETVLVIDDSPTILKVVQLVLSKAGYRVDTAADGEAGLEQARATHPALILLDFVMPRMNGYQFCRELVSDTSLKDIPVVLMSAKGDQVGERLVKVMGIVDYITKPFSPEQITRVVDQAVVRYARPRSGDGASEAGLAGAGDARAAEQAQRHAEEVRRGALEEARGRIAAEVAGRAGDSGERVAELVREALGDGILEDIVSRAAPALAAPTVAPALSGDVSAVPVADVLRLLGAGTQTGTLVVESDRGSASIHVRKGRIDQAMISDASEELLLGRFLVAAGLISHDLLDGFLAARLPDGPLLGQMLVDQSYIGAADLRQALAAQTSEIVYQALRWPRGSFAFTSTRELPAPATAAALGLDIDALLLEGFRRADEWHLIEREVADFDEVFLRNEAAVAQLGPSRLTREEQAVLELVNGKNTVKDIIRRSRMGSFDVSKLLARLLAGKLIRRRVPPMTV